MGSHDQLLKEFSAVFFDDLLPMLLPELRPHVRGDPRFLSGELQLPRPADQPRNAHPRYADLVAELNGHDGQRGLVHLELEHRYRGSVPARMLEYWCLLSLAHGLKVLPAVVFLSGGSKAGLVEETHRVRLWGQEPLVLRFKALYLEKMDPEAWLARHDAPAAAGLAALMKGGRWSPVRHKLECLRRIAAAQDLDPTHRDLLVELAESYIELDDDEAIEFEQKWQKETTMALPKMTYSERIKHQARNEGLETGLAQGREQGRAQGQEQGRREGVRRILLHQLGLRFGPLDEETRRRVGEIESLDELEGLAERVLTAASLQEMGLAQGG